MGEPTAETVPDDVRGRLDACREALRRLGSVVVAFSGGVDSTLLLKLAVETLGAENVLAVTAVSPIHPAHELDAARRLARQMGVELVEIETDELRDERFTANAPDRCYHCKAGLLRCLKALAAERKLAAVVTGANADDAGDFRPGLDAARALGAAHPLMQAGLTKDDIRAASRAMGLETWDRPSMACLASRIPYGRPVTVEKLARIERSEDALKQMGFGQYRVRDHGTVARVELPAADLPRALAAREAIAAALKEAGYAYVALDLEGFRSGSLNETLASGGAAGDK